MADRITITITHLVKLIGGGITLQITITIRRVYHKQQYSSALCTIAYKQANEYSDNNNIVEVLYIIMQVDLLKLDLIRKCAIFK